MKLVHTADLHLGYRAYHRTNRQGINIREADVARAFREMLDRVAEIKPELFLVAGDVFHTVRPSNAAIADAFHRFSRFGEQSPTTRVIIVAGNHDSPKSAEMGSILRLFDEIDNVSVVYHGARRLAFPDLDAAVLCLPHNELIAGAELAVEPEPGVAHNILLAHAAVDDDRLRLLMDFGAAKLAREKIEPESWDYVALGHYHLRSRLADNMYYAGSIERTSPNVWAEADNAWVPKDDTWPDALWGKGFVEYDLGAGSAQFHKLESPRAVIDLEPILSGHEMSPEDLDAAIESALATVEGGIEDKIVRLRVFNLPRETYRELDHRKVREHRTRALHFHLEVRPPQVVRHQRPGAPGQRLTLREELTSFVMNRWKPDSDKVDREALVELGLRYLQQAEEAGALEDRE